MARKKPAKGCVKIKNYWHCPIKGAPKCDPRSIRTVKRNKTLIRICCPKGKWSLKTKRCKVGTRGISKLIPV